jgi:hypothetical protein
MPRSYSCRAGSRQALGADLAEGTTDPRCNVVPVQGRCESCGSEDDDVVLVRRLYITPEAWDSPERVQRGDEELWCFVCRTHYPHEAPGTVPGEADRTTDDRS